MSIKWMSYIWEERTDLKGSELYCAIAIADHADADGRCFPGIATIAHKMRLKERQVQDLIKRLESKNVFDVSREFGRGKFTSFQFKKVQDSASINKPEKVQDSAKKGAGFRAEKVQDSAFPIYKEESLLEPRINRVAAHGNEPSKIFTEIFNHTLPIHTQDILTAEEISSPGLWRQILTEAKAGMTVGQIDSPSYTARQIQYALKDYRRELNKSNNGVKPTYFNGKKVLEANDPLNPTSGQFVY